MQEQKESKLLFASFPIRGQMETLKLICEYLNIPYDCKYFNPQEWRSFSQTQGNQFLYKKLPFVKKDDLVLTNMFPAAMYILEKYGHSQMLGTTQQQQIMIDSSTSFQATMDSLIELQCQHKDSPPQVKADKRDQFWRERMEHKMKKIDALVQGDWIFGKLSIVDFFLYGDFKIWSQYYPKMKKLPNLWRMYNNFANLPAIRDFQNSDRVLKETCPNNYFKTYQEQYINSKSNVKDSEKIACFSKKQEKKQGFCRYGQQNKSSKIDIE